MIFSIGFKSQEQNWQLEIANNRLKLRLDIVSEKSKDRIESNKSLQVISV